MTPIYRAEVTFMPVSSQPFSGLSDVAGKLLGLNLKTDSVSNKVIAILYSRSLAERVSKKLGLPEVFFKDSEEEITNKYIKSAEYMLHDVVDISKDTKIGLIKLSVEYKDPDLAYKIANTYASELQNMLEEKAITLAKANRLFLEKKLKETERELKSALRKLSNVQKKEKIVDPESQVKGVFELYSSLVVQKIRLQMQLDQLKSVLSPDSPNIKAIKKQIEIIDKQIKSIESRSDANSILSIVNMADKMPEYMPLYLHAKGLQVKYELIMKMYEQAKVEEQKEKIYVEIIDQPFVPEHPVKPRKRLILIVSAVSAFLLGIFLTLFMEWVHTLKERHRSDNM